MVKKTPLDVDMTTVYEGQAAKLDPLTGAFDTKPAYVIRLDPGGLEEVQ